MSTQLILYPQSYNGIHSFNSELESIVDGMIFNSINSSTSYSTATTIDNHLFATPPSIVNTWFRWRITPGAPALPVETSGALVLNAVAPSSLSGVYQKLTNLTVGASYTLTVNMTPAAGLINLKAFNLSNNSVIAGQLLSSNTTQQAITFIAQTTTDTVAILYYNTAATNLTISSISLSPTGTSPSEIYTDLIDGQVICDLYEEEDIPLTLSIDDFKNVAEQVKSYSKDFNLPATKRNNRIFNNMFEVTRADDGLIFNPYVKTQCNLKQDGFILFEGYLRMIDIKDDEGEISYNVNLYSEVVALADTLKNLTFADLDFTELEHLYNKTSIQNSWDSTGLPLIDPLTDPNEFAGAVGATNTQVLKYPFIDWTGNIGIAAAGGSPTEGNPELTSLQQAFRPCIQLKYLINKIFANTSFSWTSSLFDSADFEKLFMDFNWGAGNAPMTSETDMHGSYLELYGINFAPNGSYGNLHLNTFVGGTQSAVNVGYNTTTHKFTAAAVNQEYNINYYYEAQIVDAAAFPVPEYSHRWLLTFADGSTPEEIDLLPIAPAASQFPVFSGNFTRTLQPGDTLEAQFYSDGNNTVVQNYDNSGPSSTADVIVTITLLSVTTEILLHTLRGEIGQWDFLKGIMTMFNLVSMVDETKPNNILIEPYSDIFINITNSTTPTTPNDNSLAARSIQHDWTDKVDVSQMELNPLTDLNRNTVFKFVEDDDDYVFSFYKSATSGRLYGSKVYPPIGSPPAGFTILEGTKEIIAEPFAATISKPLFSQFSTFVIPAIFSANEDATEFEGFDNSPRIFYNNLRKNTGASFFIPDQNGLSNENQTHFLQFSHMSAIPATAPTRDFVFESKQLFPGVATVIPVDNLYNTYWSPYFNELYNADTRLMTLKVNLTPADIAKFEFYDMVFIKNRSFRVNKIEYKPNELAKVEFILIP